MSYNATSYLAAVDAHIQSITPVHEAAFLGPVVDVYRVADVVWMLDHYNTAHVTGPRNEDGEWPIETADADGVVTRYTYEAEHLRPAAAPVSFRWCSYGCATFADHDSRCTSCGR